MADVIFPSRGKRKADIAWRQTASYDLIGRGTENVYWSLGICVILKCPKNWPIAMVNWPNCSNV